MIQARKSDIKVNEGGSHFQGATLCNVVYLLELENLPFSPPPPSGSLLRLLKYSIFLEHARHPVRDFGSAKLTGGDYIGQWADSFHSDSSRSLGRKTE
jgi:hypothetical protein